MHEKASFLALSLQLNKKQNERKFENNSNKRDSEGGEENENNRNDENGSKSYEKGVKNRKDNDNYDLKNDWKSKETFDDKNESRTRSPNSENTEVSF